MKLNEVTSLVWRWKGKTPAVKLASGSRAGAGEVVKLHFPGWDPKHVNGHAVTPPGELPRMTGDASPAAAARLRANCICCAAATAAPAAPIC